MVGKQAYEIIQVLKVFAEHQDRNKLSEDIQAIIENGLKEVGIVDLSSLTDDGVLAIMFYMYGLGIIDSNFILQFASDPKREDISFYKLNIAPSEDLDKPFLISIKYMREIQTTKFNHEENDEPD